MFGFSKPSNEIAEQSVLYFEDYSYKDVNEALVGRKGESLFHLRSLDVPIPDFFVITPSVYKNFLLNAFEKKLAKLLDKVTDPEIKELEKIIMSGEFSEVIRNEILKSYSRLSGFSNAWVSVRSSVVYPQDRSASFTGIFHTELSVKGIDQVVEAIKYVYLSVFRERVVLYSREKGVDLTELQMAVVVQRMVQPEVSGVVYTKDPITNDKKLLSIEAVFGLGDVISDGAITPDQYTLSKKKLEIVEKHISPQEWMHIRKPAEKKVGSHETHQKIQISKSWSHQQKLEDHYLKDVAKVALIVETKAKSPQLLEWVWESGNVWILQHKSLVKDISTAAKQSATHQQAKSVYEVAIDIVKDEKQNLLADESQDIAEKVLDDTNDEAISNNQKSKHESRLKEDSHSEIDKKALEKEVKHLEKHHTKVGKKAEKKILKKAKKKEKKREAQDEQIQSIGKPAAGKMEMQFILSGIGASTGSVIGQLMHVDKKTPRDSIITKDDLLLIKEFSQDLEPMIIQSGGVVMDDGGLTSDVAILCREISIPAVVGTGLASSLLKDGEFLRIDGNVGSIYRYVTTKAEVEGDTAVKEKVEKEVVKESIKTKNAKEDKDKVAVSAAKQVTTEIDVEKTTAGIVSPDEVSTPLPEKILTATKVFLSNPGLGELDKLEDVMKALDGVFYIDLDELMLADGRHPLAYVEDKTYKDYAKKLEVLLDAYADLAEGGEVVVSIGSASVDDFRAMVKGKLFESKDAYGGMVGVQRLLDNRKLLTRQLSLIKKLRNTYNNRNISLAIHSPVNGALMTQMKKEITSSGLKRTGTFNLYAVMESPAEVILADEITSVGLDGLIINTPILAMHMQGLNKYQKNAKYDIGVNSVWRVVEDIVSKTKDGKIKHIVLAEDNKKVLKKAVELGVYAVAVHADFAGNAKKAVADTEAKMILSIE